MQPPSIPTMLLPVFFFASFSIHLVLVASSGMVTRTVFENVYQCPNQPKTTLHFKDIYIKRVSSTENRVFGKMVIIEDIEDMKEKVEMFKCASKSEPDTCEYYTTLQYDSVCNFIKKKMQPWYGYLNSTTMPLTCPFSKGSWEMKGIRVGMTDSLPLLPGFWRFRSKCYDKNKKLACCFFMEMTVSSHFGRKG